MIRKLLLNGADIHLKNNDGLAALEFAGKNNKLQVVRIFQKSNFLSIFDLGDPMMKLEKDRKKILMFSISHFILTILVIFLLIPIFHKKLFMIAFSYFTIYVIEMFVFIYLIFSNPGRKQKSDKNSSLLVNYIFY